MESVSADQGMGPGAVEPGLPGGAAPGSGGAESAARRRVKRSTPAERLALVQLFVEQGGRVETFCGAHDLAAATVLDRLLANAGLGGSADAAAAGAVAAGGSTAAAVGPFAHDSLR